MILNHGLNSLPSGIGGMTVTIGGRNYPIVQIGSQLWLAENLDYAWSGLVVGSTYSLSEPRANYYNDDENSYGRYGNKYGLLYNFAATSYLNNHNELLPSGWRVPSSSDLSNLITTAGGSNAAAKNLKSKSGWPSGLRGDDIYGFSAFPCGNRYNSSYENKDRFMGMFSSTANSNSYADFMIIDNAATVSSNYKSNQYSIRLVKDV